MSLFDLQDVCIAIGSLATLDLPMVVDLIGIYVLKGPYCTLTTTNWLIGGRSIPVVDLIDDLPPPTVKSQSPCDSGWSQAPVASKGDVQAGPVRERPSRSGKEHQVGTMRGCPSWSNMGCYAGSAGSIKLVHQLDEIEEQIDSSAEK
ncbi:hypothetical protein F511_36542 [Dorcoceras hygrometricum]|uniref:Uncharacterized protein n=1 Tax=Dorcoceras hygrometricum TaxID=472368 RepID=A0A2Z7CA66_9LAMI|nr:hypothetical protein F511_36542 [Dorcoceras hygrometricum]